MVRTVRVRGITLLDQTAIAKKPKVNIISQSWDIIWSNLACFFIVEHGLKILRSTLEKTFGLLAPLLLSPFIPSLHSLNQCVHFLTIFDYIN